MLGLQRDLPDHFQKLIVRLIGAAVAGMHALTAPIRLMRWALVGLLQGGMGIVWTAILQVIPDIPDGFALLLFSTLSLIGVLSCMVSAPKRVRVCRYPLSVLIFVQAAIILIGTTYSPSDLAIRKALIFIAANLVSFVSGATLGYRFRHKLYSILLLAALAMSIGIFYSLVSGGLGARWGRYGAFGIETIGAGRIVGLGMLITLYSAKGGLRSALLSIALGSGLLLAASRGPIVSLAITFLAVPLIVGSRIATVQNLKRYAVMVSVLLISSVALITLVSFSERFAVREDWGPYRLTKDADLDDVNAMARLNHARRALEHLAARPLFGWGTSGYGALSGRYEDRYYPHNLTLEILAEQGLIGFVVYCLILVQTYRHTRSLIAQAHMRRDQTLTMEITLIVAIFLYAFANAHFSSSIEGNPTVWLALGLLQAMRFDSLRRSNPPNGATLDTC